MAVFVAAGCICCSTADDSVIDKKSFETLKIADWNVQTFFDSVTDGDEYAEFRNNSSWNREAYVERLKRLADCVKRIDADVFVMEEIENDCVLKDLSNFLAGEWDFQKLYKYGCFAKNSDSSIGCGVISRFPLSDVSVHSIDVRSENSLMPPCRPVIQVTVSKGSSKVTVFVNHWKSKSNGAEVSEIWRNWQEGLLAEKLFECSAKNISFVACGDFNRDLFEFSVEDESGWVRLFRNAGLCKGIKNLECSDGEFIRVKNPWFGTDGLMKPGSYYFSEKWERIDHFFVSDNIVVKDFYAATDGPWCDKKTFIPFGYMVWNGKGYSDHLPVICTVLF